MPQISRRQRARRLSLLENDFIRAAALAPENFNTAIGRTVIGDHDLEVGKALRPHTFDRLFDGAGHGRRWYRDNDRNARHCGLVGDLGLVTLDFSIGAPVSTDALSGVVFHVPTNR